MLTIHVTPRVLVLMAVGGAVRTAAWPWLNGGVRAPSGAQADREVSKLSSSAQAHRKACELYATQAHREASPLTSMAARLARILSINGAQAAVNSLFKYKTLIANVLVRTPVCKPIASLGSQEKMCWAGFLQLLIANDLDRTPVCKVRATLQRKRLFWMTHVQPLTNNLVRFVNPCNTRIQMCS